MSSKRPLKRGKRGKVATFKVILLWVGVIAFTAPIFRSGIKGNLTFAEFVYNHTVFSDEPEYIPKEKYARYFK